MNQYILIVEDEPSIAELISVNLTHSGFAVRIAMQADEALILIREQAPQLIILDWMLPGKSGVQFAKDLRASDLGKTIPVLMLTAKGEESDKVAGLDAGADDYVTKPFSPRELIARVNALLRRYEVQEDNKSATVGALTLDPASHRVHAFLDTPKVQEILLGPTEFRLLEFLMEHPERVHSRTSLLDHVWGNDSYIEERTVDVHIKRLRSALALVACENMIETVRGSGYRLSKSVSQS
ncbi:MAG: phosphate regulon transcriptional regulator PhoB [Polynucleobacter sp.]